MMHGHGHGDMDTIFLKNGDTDTFYPFIYLFKNGDTDSLGEFIYPFIHL